MKPPIFDYLLLKIAARCNIKCTYCYWFKDKSVYELPKVLTLDAENALMIKLADHINQYNLKKFHILFHGGEPLVIGKYRFVSLIDKLQDIENRTGCNIDLSITTNGTLIDNEWISIFRYFDIKPTISIDGTKEIHDTRRIDFFGKGTYDKVITSIKLLQMNHIEPGILAVCDPTSDPKIICDHFINELGLKHFDILVPDATYEDNPISIANYYKKLFDIWYDQDSTKNMSIRYVRAMLIGILGKNSHIESIGYGPIQTCAMLTDGSLEPLDVLRIAGYKHTSTKLSIFNNTFQDIINDPIWHEAFTASLNLHDNCKKCEYLQACGGGFLPHRWSKENRYNNPSVYCSDLKEIFAHISDRIMQDTNIIVNNKRIVLHDALKNLG